MAVEHPAPPTARPQVLYVTPIFGYPPQGGPRLRTYTTLRALSRCADVTLYVWQPPDVADVESARQHVLSFCRDVIWPVPDSRQPAGLTVRGLARRLVPARLRPAVRSAARLFSPSADTRPERDDLLATLAELVRERAVDLVWLGFGGISYHLAPLKELTGRPLVLETESVWSRFILRELDVVQDPRRRAAILASGRAKQAEERWGTEYADLTTAVSEVDAAYFRSLTSAPDKVMLLSNVIDLSQYACWTDIHLLTRPAVCFPGSFSRGTANIDAALWLLDQVMPRVWQRAPQLHVYLVGRDPAPEVARRAGGRVHVTGGVPSIVPYLRQSLAAVVPLRWESGTRFKILEAFACETPVVSTWLGAEGLAVEHGRHLLLADSPDAFADSILRLHTEPDLGPTLAQHAAALVRERYDLPVAERQVQAILARLGFGVATRV